VFLNTQGESNVHRVVRPLRQLGVPAAAILDLDVIGSAVWHQHLAACGIPEERRRELDPERLWLRGAFAALPRVGGEADPLKRGGVAKLDAGNRERAEAFLRELAAYGLFLVPVGELEAWLPDVGAAGTKSVWVTNLFDLIGASPDDACYLWPGEGDIWAFIDSMHAWIANPLRHGMN
jgi:hypothetical protein